MLKEALTERKASVAARKAAMTFEEAFQAFALAPVETPSAERNALRKMLRFAKAAPQARIVMIESEGIYDAIYAQASLKFARFEQRQQKTPAPKKSAN